MRIFLVLIMLAGLAAGFAYPSLTEVFGGEQLGEIRVFGPGAVDNPEIVLTPSMAPVGINLRVTPPSGIDRPVSNPAETAFELAVVRGGADIHRSVETFRWTFSANEGAREPTLDVKERRAAVIALPESGGYGLSVTPVQPAQMPVAAVDVIIRTNVLPVDERVQPIGLLVFAAGFVGLVVSSRRRRRRKTIEPKPPEWGRGL